MKMTSHPYFIRSFIKNNKLNLVLNALGLSFIFLYNFYNINERIGDSELLAARWIESSLWFGLFICGTIFLFTFFSFLYNFVVRGARPLTTLDKKRFTRRAIGFSIGLVVAILLLIFLLLQMQTLNCSSVTLIFVSLIITVIVSCMDLLLDKYRIVMYIDLPALIALTLTIVITIIYSFLKNFPYQFISGFTAGAAGFQLIIGNILFNPKEYSARKIFPFLFGKKEDSE